MIVIGLTGSIGMGKTTVAHMLREEGIPVHDADAAVHNLLGPGGGAVAAVGAAFPDALKTDAAGRGFIDRQALGRAVFADHRLKKKLEEVLHPLVRAESDAFRAEMQKRGHKAVALDIPLLFETGGEKRVDITLCVSAPPEIQRARVMQRSGMTAEKFERIVAGQMPDAEKRKRAHHIIENDGDPEAARARLRAVLAEIGIKQSTY
jgi:dephospho-CoA kinase